MTRALLIAAMFGALASGARAQAPADASGYSRCGDGECGPDARCVPKNRCPKDSACGEFPFFCMPHSGRVEDGYPPLKRDPWRPLGAKVSSVDRALLARIFHQLSDDQAEALARLLASFSAGDGRRLEPYIKDLSGGDRLALADIVQKLSPCGAAECFGSPNFEAPLCYAAEPAVPSACERQLDGTCSWGPPRCRHGLDNCRTEDCGPKPMKGWQCADGSARGFGYCIHQPDGRCGWQFQDCPADCGITLMGNQMLVNTFACGSGFHVVCDTDHHWRCEHEACEPDANQAVPACSPGLEAHWGATSCTWECVPADHCVGGCGPGEECRVVALVPGNPAGERDGRFWGCVDPHDDFCPQKDCGPRWNLPNWRCPDGSLGGPGACVRGKSGQCYWKMRFCPASAK